MTDLRKKTVELSEPARPSRIRRDPVRAQEPTTVVGKINFNTREWEIALGVMGIIAFALALNVIWIGFSAWLAK